LSPRVPKVSSGSSAVLSEVAAALVMVVNMMALRRAVVAGKRRTKACENRVSRKAINSCVMAVAWTRLAMPQANTQLRTAAHAPRPLACALKFATNGARIILYNAVLQDLQDK